MSIGGNDVGFADMIARCVKLTRAGSRCAPGEARWVEPVVTVESAPLHRNAAGMRFAADRVVEALRAAGLEPVVPAPPPGTEPVAPGRG